MSEPGTMKKLYIIGAGVGAADLLTLRAKQLLDGADRVLSSREMALKDLFGALEHPIDGTTAVLVSGDCCFYSVAKTLIRDFADRYDIETINGISSVQYLSAKISISYDDAKIISLHGRDGSIVPFVAYNKKLFVLTGGNNKAHDICGELCRLGLSRVRVWIGERLSFPDERILSGSAQSLSGEVFADLSLLYIENKLAQNPLLPLKDEDFIRGDVPMTKEEVRHLSLQKLAIAQGDVVYDIGAGTGSVSVEMARRAFEGRAYAVEMKAAACELIEQNRRKHGAYNLEVINAVAPDGLAGLPTPQRAFIGGSSGNMDEILGFLVGLNPAVRVVANAVTMQGLSDALAGFAKHGFADTQIVCLNVAKAQKMGCYDMMMAQNPVYILSGSAGNAHE